MPTHSTLAMILCDILVLTCITAAAAELEWHRLRNEIRYPTAMREAMDACACTGSPTLWQNRRGVLKNAKNKKAKHAHDKLCKEVLAILRQQHRPTASTASASPSSASPSDGSSSAIDFEFTGRPMGPDQELADYLVACSKALDPHYDTEPKHKAQVSRKMGLQEANAQRLQTENEELRQENEKPSTRPVTRR